MITSAMSRSSILATCIVLASGCATMESGRDFDIAKAQTFVKGKTTKTEVIAAMGPPTTMGGTTDGITISYSYTHGGASNALLGAYGIGSIKSEITHKSCQFAFDRTEKLKDYTCSEGAPSGSSLGLGG